MLRPVCQTSSFAKALALDMLRKTANSGLNLELWGVAPLRSGATSTLTANSKATSGCQCERKYDDLNKPA